MIARALRSKRTLIVLALAVAALVLLVAAGPASADLLAPDKGASPNQEKIRTLYLITGIMGLIVFVGVEAVIIYAVIKFRRKRGAPDPVAVHGNSPLEIGWTIGAIVLVTVVAVVTFLFLPGIENPPKSGANGLQTAAYVPYAAVGQAPPPGGKSLRIHINGQQYIWRFDYVGEKPLDAGRPVYAYTDMYVPINTTVTLKIYSSDVIHSWWIPQLGGKADATPGHTNETWFKISKPGVYKGQCAELCGENHADMRARVIALPVDQYKAWIERQRSNILASQKALAAQRKAGIGEALSKSNQ
ncbi:MAG: cytochrome c oxidase subunit [Thermoleophilaceae bacterium]|nr:cytochrome c oxidase subunit [Thermoleophilaceae bacterium]